MIFLIIYNLKQNYLQMIHHVSLLFIIPCFLQRLWMSLRIRNEDLIQVQEVIILQKYLKTNHPKVYFNDTPVANFQNLVLIYLDKEINFLQHIKEKTSKANRDIGVIRKLRHILPRHSPSTICKSFVRPPLGYPITKR